MNTHYSHRLIDAVRCGGEKSNDQRITSLIKQLGHIKRINGVYFCLQIHKSPFDQLKMTVAVGVAFV